MRINAPRDGASQESDRAHCPRLNCLNAHAAGVDALGNLVQHAQNRNDNFSGRSTDTLQYSGPQLVYTDADRLGDLRNGGGPLVTGSLSGSPL